jgi:hypothetical protein
MAYIWDVLDNGMDNRTEHQRVPVSSAEISVLEQEREEYDFFKLASRL